MATRIPVVVMRGGTSRALFFRADDLPPEVAEQDAIFLAALGCPDPTGRQVDGLGGGASSNNKVAVIAPSQASGIDVDYTFGQLSPDRDTVDRGGNCGNISSAVGPFAIEEGMVAAADGETEVTILNTNSGRKIVARVPTPGGRFDPTGDFRIAGVPGTGSRIMLDFVSPAGPGGPLPSGRAAEQLTGPQVGSVRCSLVDAGKPTVLVPFGELGLERGTRPEQLDADPTSLERIEAVRIAGAAAMGIGGTGAVGPAVPQLAFFAPAGPRTFDVLGLSMGKAHRALPLTAAVALAAAAALPGTLIGGDDGLEIDDERPLVLRHPSGQIEVGAVIDGRDTGTPRVERVSVARSARRVLEGVVFIDR